MKIRAETLFLLTVLFAQSIYAAPPDIDPQAASAIQQTNVGRVGQDYAPSISNEFKQTTPVVGQQAKTNTNLPPEFQKITFTLNKLTITGSTIYSQPDLAAFYQQYVGKTITLAQLFSIAQAITDKYHSEGYILSQAIVPAQRIQGGNVYIQIIEGYVSSVAIQGDAYGASSLLQRYGEQIKHERPLRVQTLERYALLANDTPGLSVQAVLAPSKIAAGGADLTFITHAKRYDALVSYDNRGTVYYGPYEITAQGDVNNVLTANQTGAQGLATKDFSELDYIRLWHTEVLGSDGMQLQMAAAFTTTKPGGLLEQAPFNLVGQSNEYTIDLSYPILRSRRQNLSVDLMFDSLDSVSYYDYFDPAALAFKDKIRSLRLGGTYQRSDSWLGVNSINLVASQGMNTLGAPDETLDPAFFEPEPSRPDGRSNYTKFNLNLSRLQYLPHNWSIMLAGAGQYALNPLLAPEQIGYGGRAFGRAYDPSEITGDSGVEGDVELRYTQSPNWALLQAAQYYIYYDGGLVWNRDSLNQFSQISGTSAGLGIRFTFTNNITGGIEVDKPLTLPVAALSTFPTPTSPNGNLYFNPRVFFYIQGTL